MKIFCVGFSKTGTTSLESALESLGFDVCRGHWNRYYYYYLLALFVNHDFEELFRLTRYWDAFADAPWGGTDLYREMHRRYPDAKFILTLRDPQEWYSSFARMISEFDANPETAFESYHRHGYFGTTYFFTSLFGTNTLDRSRLVGCFERHNADAQSFFEREGCSYLLMDLSKGDGWKELCGFLEKEIPEAPFPRENVGQGSPPEKTASQGTERMLRSRLRHLSLALLGERLHGELRDALRRRR